MKTLTFSDARLTMTAPGEFFVRLVGICAYTVLTASTALLLISRVSQLQWLGALFVLFLGDRLLHFGEAERTVSDLPGSRVNVGQSLTPRAFRALNAAVRKAKAFGQDFHLVLLLGLSDIPDIREALRRLDIPREEFLARLTEYMERSAELRHGEGVEPETDSPGTDPVEALVIAAFENARGTNEQFIEPRNLFVAATAVGHPQVGKLFRLFEVTAPDIQEAAIFGRWRKLFGPIRRTPAMLSGFAHQPKFLRHRTMNRAWTARPTPALDRYSTDLTDLARAEKIGLLIGHEREFSTLLNVIARPGKPNAILVGEPGSGKSTIIAHLAFRMVKDQVPPVLFDKRLVEVNLTELIANASTEVLAGRLGKVVEEIALAGNIVLFLPNVHDLFRLAGKGAVNPIDLLLPVFRSAAIPVICETFPREFKQYIEQRTDFLELFETVPIDEITEAEATRFLVYAALLLEREYRIVITFHAARRAVQLAHRYFRHKLLPGSALDLLKLALAKAAAERRTTLDEATVIAVAETQSKIPIQQAGTAETEKLLNLEALIHRKLVNQAPAVTAVARALREYRSGLARSSGPIATFLFVGPTGVGKTELAKILTAIQFGSKDLMHRFDMSEYQEKSSIQRFIGTPDGERTGALTDAVLRDPYSLILLDEFEKAHSDILNLFLQVFDDGRLTDSLGRTADFSNTIIIATSNAHSVYIQDEVKKGRTTEDISDELKSKLTEYFRPELLNRFSDIIVFRNLSVDEIATIAGFLIRDVADSLRETHGIELAATDAAIRRLAELGWSPTFGARPLRATISERVKSVLAEKLLRKEIDRGNAIELDVEGDTFQFSVTA
ncbi:MAG: ATP-dependent Clp protease ATP-binding subunit [bacterium]|nr:ATP-dependent Clp protease ATP-binding subunit [bacterium]